MKIEENRPHGFQVSSPQAKGWVLLLPIFLVLGIVNTSMRGERVSEVLLLNFQSRQWNHQVNSVFVSMNSSHVPVYFINLFSQTPNQCITNTALQWW
jgi:hypothetical protein